MRLDEVLDGPLVALLRGPPETIAPVLARQGDERTLLVFTTTEAAERHLATLEGAPVPGLRLGSFAAGDWRGKEELLRAAADLGAVRLDVDPDMHLAPAAQVSLARALAYVFSHKNGTACL
jgi:hypothetical protein